MTEELKPKCHYHLVCHACPLDMLKEDFRTFRMALKDFVSEVNKELAIKKAHSVINRIDEWFEPHTDGYQPMFKEE